MATAAEVEAVVVVVDYFAIKLWPPSRLVRESFVRSASSTIVVVVGTRVHVGRRINSPVRQYCLECASVHNTRPHKYTGAS